MRGRMLFAPGSDRVRPTSDKVRQAIFNLLEHHPGLAGFALEGARVVDLFAGAGTLGLEALSRGASWCLFVDDAAESRAVIRRNIEALALTGVTKIWRRDAAHLGRLDTVSPFHLAFLDPPYRRGLAGLALAALRDGGWLSPGAVIVAETEDDAPLAEIPGYGQIDRRLYGDTAIHLFRLATPAVPITP